VRRQINLARRIATDLWDSEEYQVLSPKNTEATVVEIIFMVVVFRARGDESTMREIYISGMALEGKPVERIATAKWNVDVKRVREGILDILRSVSTSKESLSLMILLCSVPGKIVLRLQGLLDQNKSRVGHAAIQSSTFKIQRHR
jgi:hypothetical protein